MSEVSSRVWQHNGIAPSPAASGSSRLVQFLIIPLGGFLMMATAPWWASGLFSNAFDTDWTGFFLVPFLVLVNLALAFRMAKSDPVLRWALPVGVLVKVVAAGAYLYIFGQIYGGVADFVNYYSSGAELAQQFHDRGRLAFYLPLESGNVIRNLAGCLFLVTGPCMSAAMVLFALAGLWGQYFCYRAFCMAIPGGDRRFVAVMLFLLPSIVFWPAALGKDAVIMLAIGAAVYGFAGFLRKPSLRSLLLCGAGLLGTAPIRPHIAAMIAMGFLAAYFMGRNYSGVAGMLQKLLLVPLLLAATYYLVERVRPYAGLEDVSRTQEVLQRVARNSQIGGSAFSTGSTTASLLAAPFLLFRPFLWEARNAQSSLATLEGAFLLILLWRRRRAFLIAIRKCRTNPFVLFLLAYTFEFCLVFSVAINNFGLLARQRVMIMPMFVMLLAGPVPAAFSLRQKAPRGQPL